MSLMYWYPFCEEKISHLVSKEVLRAIREFMKEGLYYSKIENGKFLIAFGSFNKPANKKGRIDIFNKKIDIKKIVYKEIDNNQQDYESIKEICDYFDDLAIKVRKRAGIK